MKPKLMSTLAAEQIRFKYRDKQIAFAPSRDASGGFWILSVVVKDEAGHRPLPHQLAFGTEAQMAEHAAQLNDTVLGLTKDLAAAYIGSSMRGMYDHRKSYFANER